MWCRDFRRGRALPRAARLVLVLAAAGLSAGCWQPLYGSHPGGEGVQDKFAAVDIPPVSAPKGTPTERVAVGIHNALQFDLHNGGSPAPTVYVLKVSVASTQYTAYIDPTTGRPDTQIQIVIASSEWLPRSIWRLDQEHLLITFLFGNFPNSFWETLNLKEAR